MTLYSTPFQPIKLLTFEPATGRRVVAAACFTQHLTS